MGIGIVTTKYGKVQGVESQEKKYEGITYFKGIRYGASTAGEIDGRHQKTRNVGMV